MPGSETSKGVNFHYVYIIESQNDRTHRYIGYTTDLRKRITDHNQGLNQSTKPFRPWKLIYYEACLNRDDAQRRERYSKTTQGWRLLQRRLKEYLYHIKSK